MHSEFAYNIHTNKHNDEVNMPCKVEQVKSDSSTAVGGLHYAPIPDLNDRVQ